MNQRPLGYEYNTAMTGDPLILREKRSTVDGSTFSVDAWFLSLFRHISGCCGSKMGAETWPCPGTVTSVVRVANVLATDDVARTLGAIGASGPGCGCQQGAWVSTDATERFCSPGNVLPNSTSVNDPRMLCPRMLRRDDELQPDRGRFTREEPWAWPYPERGLSYPSWE